MERWLALFSTVLLLCCLAGGILSLAAWTQSRDIWGLYCAAFSLSAGYAAHHLLNSVEGG